MKYCKNCKYKKECQEFGGCLLLDVAEISQILSKKVCEMLAENINQDEYDIFVWTNTHILEE